MNFLIGFLIGILIGAAIAVIFSRDKIIEYKRLGDQKTNELIELLNLTEDID